MNQGRSTTKRLLAAGAAVLGLLAAGSAMADNVYWSVGVSAPIDGGRVRTHVGNVPPAAPVVVAPVPVYAPPPPPAYVYPTAYYDAAPRVVYAPPPVVYGRGYGWRHDHGWGRPEWRGMAYRHVYRDGYREGRRDGWHDGRRDGHRH